jgi:hypothetical protein
MDVGTLAVPRTRRLRIVARRLFDERQPGHPLKITNGAVGTTSLRSTRRPPRSWTQLCAWGSISDVSETVAKELTSREWFRERGGHCIDCRDHVSPRVAR